VRVKKNKSVQWIQSCIFSLLFQNKKLVSYYYEMERERERELRMPIHIITITIIIIIIIIIIQTLLILTHFNPTVTNILLLILTIGTLLFPILMLSCCIGQLHFVDPCLFCSLDVRLASAWCFLIHTESIH
jgi:uncharacterized membrane protein